MKYYAAYGLTFESDFDLSPLPAIELDQADVVIKSASVVSTGLESPRVSRATAQINDASVWMDIPNIARIQVSEGKYILVDPYPDADERSIRLYIMGSAIGAILHQRGRLVLHANAIRVGEAVVLFAGVSGSGKSTTAAAFHQKGFAVISDDVVALNDEGSIIGGVPQIKLWQDALEKLGIPSEGLPPIRLQLNKYGLPIDPFHSECHLPVAAIYILGRAHQKQPDHFGLTHLSGMEKFHALTRHTYRRHFVEGLGLRPMHLKRCTELASNLHMANIIRPTGHFNAPQLADRVLQDLQSLGLYQPV